MVCPGWDSNPHGVATRGFKPPRNRPAGVVSSVQWSVVWPVRPCSPSSALPCVLPYRPVAVQESVQPDRLHAGGDPHRDKELATFSACMRSVPSERPQYGDVPDHHPRHAIGVVDARTDGPRPAPGCRRSAPCSSVGLDGATRIHRAAGLLAGLAITGCLPNASSRRSRTRRAGIVPVLSDRALTASNVAMSLWPAAGRRSGVRDACHCMPLGTRCGSADGHLSCSRG
jgi:hypothetical protein